MGKLAYLSYVIRLVVTFKNATSVKKVIGKGVIPRFPPIADDFLSS